MLASAKRRSTHVLAAAAVMVAAALPASAEAIIYWSNVDTLDGSGGSLGRASLDGSNADNAWLRPGFGADDIAVNDTHVYWLSVDYDTYAASIGRANLDGSGMTFDLITMPAGTDPGGLAVNNTHIFWTASEGEGSLDSIIGRATLDGREVQRRFIADGGYQATHIALDDTHIYWAHDRQYEDPELDYFPSGQIGRANLDGTGVDSAFIGTGDLWGPDGVAVNDTHVFWSNPDPSENSIGRANISGTGVDPTFIDNAKTPIGLAVDQTHIYWASYFDWDRDTDTIIRARLDGTGVEPNFITGAIQPRGIAVDATPHAPPPTQPDDSQRAEGEVEASRKQRVGRLAVRVGCGRSACRGSARGRAVIRRWGVAGKKHTFRLTRRSFSAPAGNSTRVKLRFKKHHRTVKKIRRLLRRKAARHGAHVKVRVRLIAGAGNASVETVRITLRR